MSLANITEEEARIAASKAFEPGHNRAIGDDYFQLFIYVTTDGAGGRQEDALRALERIRGRSTP